MPRARALVWLAAGALAAACWRSPPPPPPPFRLDRVSPAEVAAGEPLLLNDSITLYFSGPVHPLSVTADAITVLDVDGNAVTDVALKRGTSWVTLTPEPPLSPELTDGSFRPGETYRLVVAGYPRPDAIRAADGRRLEKGMSFELRMAGRGPFGDLPAPLRPPGPDLPFLLRGNDQVQPLPADAPKMRLHFTSPVLPESARPAAFVVSLARAAGLRQLAPRTVRVVTSRLDRHPGSTVELDLGREPRVRDGGPPVVLQAGDWLSVALVEGEGALRDLSGCAAFAPLEQCWSVVPGSVVSLLAWPEDQGGLDGEDWLLPGFEAQAGLVRPRVRVEVGDGSLGVFRPTRDTVLRPGVPFDRGDGVVVQSRGVEFPFLAVEIPEGVRVRVEGHGARLQACGGIHVAGVLELEGMMAGIPPVQHGAAVSELIDLAPVTILAAGDVVIEGAIVTATELPPDQTALTLASAGRIHLSGELPYNTMLAVEAQAAGSSSPILGPRGQSLARAVLFTYGLAPGAEFVARAATPWSRMPDDRDGGILRLVDPDQGLAVSWQVAPPDAVDPGLPDVRAGRASRPREARDGEWIPVAPGAFFRVAIEARLEAGQPLPRLRELRLVDR